MGAGEERWASKDVLAVGGVVFRNRVSRMVMDPERFEDDANEEMAKRGMGAVYVRRHDGTPLRAGVTTAINTPFARRDRGPLHNPARGAA